MRISAEPLTAQAFAPFGQVIWADPAHAVEINDGFTTRFDDLARPELEGGDANFSIFRGRPRPLVMTTLERHPFGTQAFIPLGGAQWLAVVAEAPEAPRAFLCEGWQGVQYGRNVWHHPLLVLGGAQDFLVVDRTDPINNLEVTDFAEPVEIIL